MAGRGAWPDVPGDWRGGSWPPERFRWRASSLRTTIMGTETTMAAAPPRTTKMNTPATTGITDTPVSTTSVMNTAAIRAATPAPTLMPGCTGRRGRAGMGWLGAAAGSAGEVGGERGKVGVGPRGGGLGRPRNEFVLSQPALDEGGLEPVYGLVTVGVRRTHAGARDLLVPLVSRHRRLR